MPKRIKKIELDINKKDRSVKFFAKQYEDICVEVAITDGGTIVDFTNCIIEETISLCPFKTEIGVSEYG